MKALIVTGGFIDDEFTLDYVKGQVYDVVFAVDKGLHFFSRTGMTPDYMVGDFDSVEDSVLKAFLEEARVCFEEQEDFGRQEPGAGETPEQTPQVIRLNPMKDDTDTEHAVRMALKMGCDSIHLFGATGTRLDHVLGNLQLLGLCLSKNAECLMIDPWNRIRLIDRETVLHKDSQFGKYVSLIPYTTQVTGLTLTGFVYPLTDYTMQSFYVKDALPISGVSNEIAGDTARVTLKDGILVLVESRD